MPWLGAARLLKVTLGVGISRSYAQDFFVLRDGFRVTAFGEQGVRQVAARLQQIGARLHRLLELRNGLIGHAARGIDQQVVNDAA